MDYSDSGDLQDDITYGTVDRDDREHKGSPTAGAECKELITGGVRLIDIVFIAFLPEALQILEQFTR